MRNVSRRGFLVAMGGLAAACGGTAVVPATPRSAAPMVARDGELAADASPGAPATAAATPTPRPVPPAGVEEHVLLAGTPYETKLVIRYSGVAGPAAMVLGGVHGNEPGGWGAAEVVSGWTPASGSLLVLPRANVVATRDFVRTTDALGDLNRLYPGDPASAFPMEQMAAAIVQTARDFGVELLLDLHESWQFYVDAPGTGTAALGQTVTAGVGPRQADLAAAIAAKVNPQLGQREQLILRDGNAFRRPDGAGGTTTTGRGRSSLSMGGHVPGLTPVLVEMGQQGQAVERRVELHLLVARAALESVGIL